MTMQVPMQIVATPSGGFEGSPDSGSRIVDWLRRNLFSSISNTLLTVLVVAAFALIIPPGLQLGDRALRTGALKVTMRAAARASRHSSESG
jgi:hypothetical protein